MTSLFAFFNLGAQEMIILLIIGVLLFGRKLPEVGRYLGKGIVEFKKGIKGLEDELDTTASVTPRQEPAALEQPRPPQATADDGGEVRGQPGQYHDSAEGLTASS